MASTGDSVETEGTGDTADNPVETKNLAIGAEDNAVARSGKGKKKYQEPRYLLELKEAIPGPAISKIERDGVTLYACPQCPHTNRSMKSCANHVRSRHGYRCDVCGFTASRPIQIKVHKRTAHKDVTSATAPTEAPHPMVPPVYKCDHCNFTCSAKFSIERHMEAQHSIYTCKLCPDLAFGSSLLLSAHEAQFHPPPLFTCSECEFAAADKSDLDRHVAVDHAAFRCGQCDYRSANRNDLSRHVSLAHVPEDNSVGSASGIGNKRMTPNGSDGVPAKKMRKGIKVYFGLFDETTRSKSISSSSNATKNDQSAAFVDNADDPLAIHSSVIVKEEEDGIGGGEEAAQESTEDREEGLDSHKEHVPEPVQGPTVVERMEGAGVDVKYWSECMDAASTCSLCSTCQRMNRADLLLHMARTHGCEECYFCTECAYSTSLRSCLEMHMTNLH